MKLKETYFLKKEKYLEYIILIKCGNFYEVLEDDAYILNTLFNYKIKKTSNITKVGFPIVALNKVILRLQMLKINYLIVNPNGDIKKKFNNNKYRNFLEKPTNLDRINLIYQRLLDIKGDDIDALLNNIEEIIWRIIY